MTTLRIRNAERDALLGDRIRVADRWWPRLRGLIGRPEPDAGEGLLIAPSQGVHMHWMRYALDVALLDEQRRVVAVYPELRPWRHTKMHRDAEYALELPVGTLRATETSVGDRLEWSADGRPA
ncbi:MAG: DUF192 domain-containing protein [Gemmatimonadota bacterium]